MSKNNPMGKTVPEKRNYKLYKAKKQWVTACATFLFLFGTAAVFQEEDVHADPTGTTSQAVVAGSNSSTLQSSAADTSTAQGGSTAANTSDNDSQSTASAAPASQNSAASAQPAASAAPASAAGVASAAKFSQSSSSTANSSAAASASTADDSLELPVSAFAASETAKANSSLLTVSLYSTDATTTITADNIPDGAINEDGSAVTKDDFTKTVTRTITFDFADKASTTEVQKATLTRTGNYDATTKKVTWNDYSTGSFARLNTPSDGDYTPSMRYIQPVNDVTADYVDPQIVVTYALKTQRFIRVETFDDDDNGAVIANTTVQSYYGAVIHFKDLSSTQGKLLIPSGYELAAGQSATITVPNRNLFGANTVKVHLVHKTVNKTYTFVNDDDSEAVVGSPITVSGRWGVATDTGLTIPDGYELASGQTLPTSVTLNETTNDPVTIHLVYKTQETRQLTVKYINAKTGESMGSLAPDAVLDVYYKRTVTKDPTTGELTLGDWFWDTSQGDAATPGYHVVSGTWTTPADWADVVATVPTVSGYTSFTSGDWEKVGTNTSATPANEFVFPAWNNDDNGTTDTSKGSLAYTSDANTYEATATHTVYFVPDETTAKTVTVNYKYYENGQVGGDVYSPAQLKIYYRAKATGYSTTGGITYGDYAFDITAGDTSTPGFHVISVPDGASWDNLATVTSTNGNASIHAPIPKKDGYTAIIYASSDQSNKNAEWIAAPVTRGHLRAILTPLGTIVYHGRSTMFLTATSARRSPGRLILLSRVSLPSPRPRLPIFLGQQY